MTVTGETRQSRQGFTGPKRSRRCARFTLVNRNECAVGWPRPCPAECASAGYRAPFWFSWAEQRPGSAAPSPLSETEAACFASSKPNDGETLSYCLMTGFPGPFLETSQLFVSFGATPKVVTTTRSLLTTPQTRNSSRSSTAELPWLGPRLGSVLPDHSPPSAPQRDPRRGAQLAAYVPMDSRQAAARRARWLIVGPAGLLPPLWQRRVSLSLHLVFVRAGSGC